MNVKRAFKLKKLPIKGKVCPSRVLSFIIQIQQQTQWCWSACAVSVNHYYSPGSNWTQCTLVNVALGQSNCCSSGGSAACNQPWFLDRALAITGNFVSYSSGKASMATITGEINGDRVLGMRIGWSGGGGHFTIIYGYKDCGSTGTQNVYVGDPWYGSSVQAYRSFPAGYHGGGSWSGSYFTKP